MTVAAVTIVGRRSELAELERFVAGTGSEAAALAIVGPAGIGKSILWSAGVELARSARFRILSARPTGAEASLSFAGLADLLAPVDLASVQLPPPQRHALDVALLREQAEGPRVDSRAVATATLTLLRELASQQPTLIAVDDAPWLDEATAEILRFVLRRLAGVPVAVLTSIRLEGQRPQTFETALPDEKRVEIALAPLSAAAVHDVVQERLGVSLRRPTLIKITHASGGNVFYAIEIARELASRPSEGDALPVPPTAHALVRARTERLPARARRALLDASALAVPTTRLVSDEDLLAAEEAGLVRVERDGRITFEHPLVAAAVYDDTPAARRRDAHRRLAALVENKEERARHLALAAHRPDEAIATALDDAAAHTAARGASAAAAELAELALRLTPDERGAVRVRRALTLAHHLLDAGESSAARAVLEECELESVGGDARAEILRELGRILWFEGEHDSGYDLVRKALEHAQDAEVAARTHAAAAWIVQDVDLDLAITHADAALALLDPGETPGLYSWSLLYVAYLRLLNGQGSDEEAFRRGRDLQQRVVDWEDTSPVVGMWPVVHDRFAEARALYERGLERSREEGDELSVQGTLLRLAEIDCWTGDWAEAERLASEGIALADDIGSSAYLGSALYARALVDAHLGRVDEARAAADRIVELFGYGVQAVLGHWVLGFVALSLGEVARADEHYLQAAAAVERLHQREPARFRFEPDHLEVVVELGDLPRAHAMLASLEARAQVFPRPWILATGARCRALVLAASGDLAAALEAAEDALHEHDRLDMPFEHARTLLVAGQILRRLKQKRRAREMLAHAQRIFDELGAVLWAARARDELARVAARRAPVELSATELQVAKLAAAGLTNREIASQVFVSPKTVEANLARAYRKLGISSRAQLDRALQQGSAM